MTSATQFLKLRKPPGRLVRFFRIFSPSREPGVSLSDFTSEKVFRSARIVAGSIEGPRFVPGDASSSEDVIKKMDLLVRAEPRLRASSAHEKTCPASLRAQRSQ